MVTYKIGDRVAFHPEDDPAMTSDYLAGSGQVGTIIRDTQPTHAGHWRIKFDHDFRPIMNPQRPERWVNPVEGWTLRESSIRPAIKTTTSAWS